MYDLKTIVVFPCQPTNATAFFLFVYFFGFGNGTTPVRYATVTDHVKTTSGPPVARRAPGVPCSAGPAAVGGREEQQLAHVGRGAGARRSDEDVPPPLPVRPCWASDFR